MHASSARSASSIAGRFVSPHPLLRRQAAIDMLAAIRGDPHNAVANYKLLTSLLTSPAHAHTPRVAADCLVAVTAVRVRNESDQTAILQSIALVLDGFRSWADVSVVVSLLCKLLGLLAVYLGHQRSNTTRINNDEDLRYFTLEGQNQHPLITVLTECPTLWSDMVHQLPVLFSTRCCSDFNQELAYRNASTSYQVYQHSVFMLMLPLLRFAVLNPNIDVKRSFTTHNTHTIGLHFQKVLLYPKGFDIPVSSIISFVLDQLSIASSSSNDASAARAMEMFLTSCIAWLVPIPEEPHTDKTLLLGQVVHAFLQNTVVHPPAQSWIQLLVILTLVQLCNALQQEEVGNATDIELPFTQYCQLMDALLNVTSIPSWFAALIFPMLCYIMLSIEIIELSTRQLGLLRAIESCLRCSDAPLHPFVQQLAIVPLLTVITIMSAKQANEADRVISACDNAIDLIVEAKKCLQLISLVPFSESESAVKTESSYFDNISGIAAELLASVTHTIEQLSINDDISSIVHRFEQPYHVLLLVPILLDARYAKRALEYLHKSSQSLSFGGVNNIRTFVSRHAYTLLPLFFYLINVNLTQTSPQKCHGYPLIILLHHFPSLLISTHDAYVTAKLFSLFSAWADTTMSDMVTSISLASMAFTLMTRLYIIHPRCYMYLRAALYGWAKKNKPQYTKTAFSNCSKTQTIDYERARVELEVTVASCIRNIFDVDNVELTTDSSSSVKHDEDLLPLVYMFLQFEQIHPTTTAMLLDCVIACVRRRAMVVTAAWDVIIARIAKRCYSFLREQQQFDNQTPVSQGMVTIISKLFDFFAEVGKQCDIGSEMSETVIFDYIYPLLPFVAPEPLTTPQEEVDASATSEDGNDETSLLAVFKLPAQINHQSSVLHALSITALTHFTNVECFALRRILPGPKEMVAIALTNLPHDDVVLAWQNLLAWLVRYEMEQMPRSIFSAHGSSAPVSVRRDRTTGSAYVLDARLMLQEVCMEMEKRRQSNTAPTAIRGALIGTHSFVIDSYVDYNKYIFNTKAMHVIGALMLTPLAVNTTTYASLVHVINAMADVTFTDHLYMRLQIVPYYTNCFIQAFARMLPSRTHFAAELDSVLVLNSGLNTHPDTEILLGAAENLLFIFQQAVTPSAKSNSSCALVGFAIALNHCRLPHTQFFSEMAQCVVSQRFLRRGNTIKLPTLDWGKLFSSHPGDTAIDERIVKLKNLAQVQRDASDLSSDEIQSFVYLALSALIGVTGDDMFTSDLVTDMTTTLGSGLNDWSSFAAAFGLAYIYDTRYTTRSSASVYLNEIANSLLNTFQSSTDARAQMGASMGLAFLAGRSRLVQLEHCQKAEQALTDALTQSNKESSLLAGYFQILAADIINNNNMHATEDVTRIVNLLHECLTSESVRFESSDLGNVFNAFCQTLAVLQGRLNVSEEIRQMYKTYLRDQFKILIKSTTMTNIRISALFAVTALLGYDALLPISARAISTTTVIILSKTGVETLRMMLPSLLELAGVRGKFTQPKVSRIMLMVLSWILVSVNNALLQTNDVNGETSIITSGTARTEGGKEPENYGRLGVDISWLRNIFDRIQQGSIELLDSGLEILSKVNHPLPLVDFYPLLERLARHGIKEAGDAFKFASIYASSSYSALDYVLDVVLCHRLSISSIELAVSEIGVGKLLSIAGLLSVQESSMMNKRRGRKGEIMSLAEDKALDVVKHLLKELFDYAQPVEFEKRYTELRLIFLTTLTAHMPNYPPLSSASLHGLLVEHLIGFHASHEDLHPDVNHLIVRCAIFSTILFETLPSITPGTISHLHLLNTLLSVVSLSIERSVISSGIQQLDERSVESTRREVDTEIILTRVIYHALCYHLTCESLHHALLEVLTQRINQQHVPAVQANVMTSVEIGKQQSVLREEYIMKWLIRLGDILILLATQRNSGVWMHVRFGLHVYVKGVLDIAVLTSRQATQSTTTLQNCNVDDRLSSRQLASQLARYLRLSTSGEMLENQMLKRLVGVLRGLQKGALSQAEEFHDVVQQVTARLRYRPSSIAEWTMIYG